MPKSEWGVKRLCGECGERFYDLGRDPVDCPECGATYLSAVAMAEKAKATKAMAKAAAATAAAKAEEEDVVDDDDLEVADDDADDSVDLDDDDDDDDDAAVDSVLLDDDDDDDDLGEFKTGSSDDKET